MGSQRLQVLIPERLQRRVQKAAQRSGQSTAAWLRAAIERHLGEEHHKQDPLDQLKSLGGPTGDIDEMLSDIALGRG